MIAVVSSKDLACCRCDYVRKYKGSNGWTCSLTNEIGYPCYANADDRLENCPLINKDFKKLKKDAQRYCESPALGMGAPKCNEDCCDYGGCHKQAYFDFIKKKYPHAKLLHSCQDCGILLTPEQEGKICETAGGITYFLCKKCYKTKNDSLVANQPDKFVIEDREYSNEEVLEILKKHKEEEDKKYIKCDKCGDKYLENNLINMVDCNLDEKPDYSSAWGYSSIPYIRGFKILSTCGDGKEVKLCDKCIKELVDWLDIKIEKHSVANYTGKPALIAENITPSKRNKIKIGRKRR